MLKSADWFSLSGERMAHSPAAQSAIDAMQQGFVDSAWMLDSNDSSKGKGGLFKNNDNMKTAGLIPNYENDKSELAYCCKKAAAAETTSTRNYWVKKAADFMGNNNDQELETAIFTLSSHFIKDKAPKLFDMGYFVGFRVLDKNDDNTKVVGIYGFKIGKAWVYIPIFFDGGKISGYDLCYLQSKDQFVPVKEGWIDWIIKNSGDDVFGRKDRNDFRALGVRYPDMKQLTQPPVLGKVASFAPWVQVGVLSLAKLAGEEIPQDKIADLEKIASRDPAVFAGLVQACYKYPFLKTAMDSFYGEKFFDRTYTRLDNAFSKIAAAAKRRQGRMPIKPRCKRASVNIITQDDSAAFPLLTEKQAAELIETGNLVLDERRDDEVASVEDEMKFNSPNDTGVYDVFFADGSIRECLVIINPLFSQNKGIDNRCLVVDWKRRTGLWAKPAAVLCVTGSDKEDWFNRLPADEFKSPTSMRNSDAKQCRNRVIVAPDGTGTLPITAYNRDGAWQTNEFIDDYSDNRDRTYDVKHEGVDITLSHLQDLMVSNKNNCPANKIKGCMPRWIICSSTFAGKKMVLRDDKLLLPAKFKFIDLDDLWDDAKVLPLATENDLVDILFNNRKKLKAVKTASKYRLDSKELTKKEAFATLVKEYDFRAKTANEILTALELVGGETLQIPYIEAQYKTAELPFDKTQPMGGNLSDIGENMMSPIFQDVPMDSDSYSGLPIQGTMSDAQQLGFEDQPTPTDWLNEVPPPDEMALQQAAEAAQTGSKDIFDVSMLAGLLNTNRNSDLILEYTKIFKVALDRIGRTLFKLYWDKEAFIDQYGQEDIVKLEDTLKDVLDTLGDLTLFMVQKNDKPELEGFLDDIGTEDE